MSVVLVTVVAVASCGRETRPDAATWGDRWEETLAVVPPADTFAGGPDPQVCEDVLVDLREARPGLSPAPDEVVGEALTAWITVAESTFFECFDDDAGADSIAEAYARLDQLESEVTAALSGSTGANTDRDD